MENPSKLSTLSKKVDGDENHVADLDQALAVVGKLHIYI